MKLIGDFLIGCYRLARWLAIAAAIVFAGWLLRLAYLAGAAS